MKCKRKWKWLGTNPIVSKAIYWCECCGTIKMAGEKSTRYYRPKESKE